MITTTIFCGLSFIVCQPTAQEVKQEIIRQAQSSTISARAALRIASCESKFLYNAKNPHSTAKGIYQFTDKTWQNYCYGDPFNYQNNIKCFFKLFPKHQSWWQCK